MITKDLGMVTAYAYAVSKGYTGTETQFAELMASYASVAQEAVNAALAAAQSAQDAESAKDTAQTTVSGAIAGIQAEGQTQIGAVQSEGTTQVGNVNSAGQTQVGNVNAAGANQVDAVQAKGAEVLDSIPSDYTALSGEVSGLKSALTPPIIANSDPKHSSTVIRYGGATGTYSGWYQSDNIDVSEYQLMALEYTCAAYGSHGSSVNIPPVVFLDYAGNYLDAVEATWGNFDARPVSGEVKIPLGAKYMLLTSGETLYYTTMAKAKIKMSLKDPFCDPVFNSAPFQNTSVILYGGATGSYQGWYQSADIEIGNHGGDILYYTCAAYGTHDSAINIPPVVFLSEDKQYIDAVEATTGIAAAAPHSGTCIVPSGAKYIRLTSAMISDVTTKAIAYIKRLEPIEHIANDGPLFTTEVFTYGGTKATYPRWYQSDAIDITAFLGYTLRYTCAAYGSHGSSVNIPPVVFLDYNKAYVTAVESTVGISNGKPWTGKTVIPQNAKYLVLTSYNDDERDVHCYGSAYVDFTKEDKTKPNRFTDNGVKVVCVGDSTTHGDYGSEPEGTANDHLECYPWFMAQELGLDYKRGWIAGEMSDSDFGVINLGMNGATPISWYNTNWDTYKGVFDYNNNQKLTVVIMFGANCQFTDTVGSDTSSSASQIGYYKKIIEGIFTQSQGNAQIILMTPAYVDPTKRSLHSQYVIADNPIVKKLAAFYNLPCIDVYNELGDSEFTTSLFQPIDGLHFGYTGYSKLGTFVLSKLNSLLSFKL